MTKHEKLVVSAYTGYLMTSFAEFHEYVEKVLARPIFTHELGEEILTHKLQDAVREDFYKICKEE